MLKIFGSILVLVSCCLFGNHLSKKAESALLTTKSMKSFVSHVSVSIKTLRAPLKEIFASYEDNYLDAIGITNLISSFNTESILKILRDKMTSEGFNSVKYFFDNLGGIDIDEQCRICKYVEDKLSAELNSINNTYKEKKRMYQLLPILCGLSVIILLV